MDAATHLIAAMRDRPDRIAFVLWNWLQRDKRTIEQLCAYMGCNATTIERLALVAMPRPGPDWDDDVEIIAFSLRLHHNALRAILQEAEPPNAREIGA